MVRYTVNICSCFIAQFVYILSVHCALFFYLILIYPIFFRLFILYCIINRDGRGVE